MAMTRAGALLLGLAAAGCTESLPARPQLLVVVDTNVPTVGQLAADAGLSVDAAIDTLRLDVLDDRGEVVSVTEAVVPDASSWPVSFGVLSRGEGEARLRIRVFRAARASSELVAGTRALRPRPELSIDRILRVPLPAEDDGVAIIGALLDGDCWGVAADPASASTCIDADLRWAGATRGIEVLDEEPQTTRAGTWAHARAEPCRGPAPHPEAVCIPGGFSVLGDAALEDGGVVPFTFPSQGLRPVVMSPFWLDRTEFRVGRMRELKLRGDDPGLVSIKNPSHAVGRRCTWLSATDPTMDEHPVVCIGRPTAEQACAFEGGRLPTEAQWEHAARGRGQGRRFPWGDASPRCCTASLQQGTTCPALGTDGGPEPVGAHAPSEGCEGLGDASRDGLLDMGGNVSEWCADVLARYDEPCWSQPTVLFDPVCLESEGMLPSARGAAYVDGPLASASAARFIGTSAGPQQGFRCAYPDAP